MMEGNSVLFRNNMLTTIERVYQKNRSWASANVVNPVYENLVNEGFSSFLEYLRWHGLANEPEMLVLSSRHHFFYDQNDMEGIRVLVNLKKLNKIKALDKFLNVLHRVLQPDANFTGCFIDSKNHRWNGSNLFKTSYLYKRFIDFLDHRTDRVMTRNSVKELLEFHGFRIIDMTEINGITYFNTLNQRKYGE
ncbi:MAG: hypothetical protein GX876_12910 [Bacteroidales bacterium]|nr:hypothetical protein [Bacteroidales bacterium]